MLIYVISHSVQQRLGVFISSEQSAARSRLMELAWFRMFSRDELIPPIRVGACRIIGLPMSVRWR